MDTGVYEIYERLNRPAEEAYKTLRTNIQFVDTDKKIKTIAVTSYRPGEGKTTTAINLGISMAKSGMKVLYVDADLRKPVVMKRLGNSKLKGLTNFLSGYVTLEEIIVTTSVQDFKFVTCGIRPVNAAELIGTERFRVFLETVREMFDMVIIDTPPLGSVIDSALISSYTDGTIIVLQPGTVKRKYAKMMSEHLRKANARLLGVVLNKLPRSEYKDYFENFDYYGSKKEYARDWYEHIKK